MIFIFHTLPPKLVPFYQNDDVKKRVSLYQGAMTIDQSSGEVLVHDLLLPDTDKKK